MLSLRHTAAAARPQQLAQPPCACLRGHLARASARGLSGGCRAARTAALGGGPAPSSTPRTAGGFSATAHAAAPPLHRRQVVARAAEPATRPEAAPGVGPPLPPVTPPLHHLPTPTAADAIPPLLDWVTSAAARPVAVQCILERFFSPQALQCVRAAAELALTGGGVQGPLVHPSHLALAALSSPHPDCAAALGVLHYGGLPLRPCEQLLLAAAEEESARASAVGSSSQLGNGVFSPAAQHFVLQAYRWAVYNECDLVAPCHLLWALSADPRVAYSRDRRDPLDPAVRPWRDWRPPLVGLMEAAAAAELLERPAPMYEQLLGVLQRAISGTPTTQALIAGAAAGESGSAPAASPAAALKASQLHRALTDRLTKACQCTADVAGTNELLGAVCSCRAAGLVLSRAQLQAIDSYMRNYLTTTHISHGSRQYYSVPPGLLGCQYIIGAAALGYKSWVASGNISLDRLYSPPPLPPGGSLPYVYGPTTPDDPTIELVCELALALRLHYGDVSRAITKVTWLRCEGPSQSLAQQADELLLLSDTLAAIDPSGSTGPGSLYSLLAGRAAVLAAALGGAGGAGGAAIAAYISATAAPTTADKLPRLAWPADGSVPPWLERLTLQQRVRLLAHLAAGRATQAAPASSSVSLEASPLVIVTAAINECCASVHASLELQRQAAVALAAAGQPVSEGWVRQLVSYGAVASKHASDALLALLAALASRAEAAPAESPPPPELLATLAKLLWANAQLPHMPTNEGLQALERLRRLYDAAGADATGFDAEGLALAILTAGAARGGDLAALAPATAAVYGTHAGLLDSRQQLAFLGLAQRATGGSTEAAAEQQHEAPAAVGGPDP